MRGICNFNFIPHYLSDCVTESHNHLVSWLFICLGFGVSGKEMYIQDRLTGNLSVPLLPLFDVPEMEVFFCALVGWAIEN